VVAQRLGLPSGLLRWMGIVVLALLGVGLLVPKFGGILDRPFARLAAGRQVTEGGRFAPGLSLGLVFVPRAGPVLAAIAEVGAQHCVGWSAVLVTALVLALNLTEGLQRAVPSYTGALQNRIEGNSSATRALAGVTGKATGGALSNCMPASPAR
jgi:hypothetical protein